MADESELWISAIEAYELVASATNGRYRTAHTICSRARAGLIQARAKTLIIGGRSVSDAFIPAEFWWAGGEAALRQNWRIGDFETWIDRRVRMQAFGVSFSRPAIESLIAPAIANREPARPAQVNGRPPAAFWDDLWIEICCQLYVGALIPKKQSDLEAAMMDWATKHGHDPSESTIRPRARKLWTALQKKDKN
jgi:hypothetical protein